MQRNGEPLKCNCTNKGEDFSHYLKSLKEPWPEWLSGLECHPVTGRYLVQFWFGSVPRLRAQSPVVARAGGS